MFLWDDLYKKTFDGERRAWGALLGEEEEAGEEVEGVEGEGLPPDHHRGQARSVGCRWRVMDEHGQTTDERGESTGRSGGGGGTQSRGGGITNWYV